MNTKRFLAIICLFAAACLNASACSVPVFRYALERWPADIYRMTIFHRGPLSPEQRAVVDAVNHASEEGLVNMGVRLVDVAGQMSDAMAKLLAAQPSKDLPWALVQYPAVTGFEQPVAQGFLDAKFAQEVMDSPARREVRDRILKGESAVWVLLESGDKQQDDKVDRQLRAESKKLAELLEIPPVDPNDPRTDVNVTLKIAFSALRLSRSTPAEQFFVNQLVNIHPKLAEAKGPIVFPVFGRGRALCGLADKELTVENIQEIAVFLTGACSCEVKSMNPGVDLLFAADWDAALEGRAVKDPEMPPLVSLSQLAAEAQPPAKTKEQPADAPPGTALTRNLIVAVALGILAVVAGTMLLRRKVRN
ncbi:MAG: hypothetical protein FJ395_02570 [Verrucomicrobia bacterium]|nr:hypothetical protein [Verrucomicrobiota bacterium]